VLDTEEFIAGITMLAGSASITGTLLKLINTEFICRPIISPKLEIVVFEKQ